MPQVAADKCEAHFQSRRDQILILGVAHGLFSSRGFDATTVDQIACGVGSDQLRPVEPSIAAQCLFGILWMFLLTQELLGGAELGPLSDDEMVSTVTRIFLNGAAISHQSGRV